MTIEDEVKLPPSFNSLVIVGPSRVYKRSRSAFRHRIAKRILTDLALYMRRLQDEPLTVPPILAAGMVPYRGWWHVDHIVPVDRGVAMATLTGPARVAAVSTFLKNVGEMSTLTGTFDMLTTPIDSAPQNLHVHTDQDGCPSKIVLVDAFPPLLRDRSGTLRSDLLIYGQYRDQAFRYHTILGSKTAIICGSVYRAITTDPTFIDAILGLSSGALRSPKSRADLAEWCDAQLSGADSRLRDAARREIRTGFPYFEPCFIAYRRFGDLPENLHLPRYSPAFAITPKAPTNWPPAAVTATL